MSSLATKSLQSVLRVICSSACTLGFATRVESRSPPWGLLQAYFNAPALARPFGIPFICAVAALLLLGHSGAMPGVACLATTQMNETGALKHTCSKPGLLQEYFNTPALVRALMRHLRMLLMKQNTLVVDPDLLSVVPEFAPSGINSRFKILL